MRRLCLSGIFFVLVAFFFLPPENVNACCDSSACAYHCKDDKGNPIPACTYNCSRIPTDCPKNGEGDCTWSIGNTCTNWCNNGDCSPGPCATGYCINQICCDGHVSDTQVVACGGACGSGCSGDTPYCCDDGCSANPCSETFHQTCHITSFKDSSGNDVTDFNNLLTGSSYTINLGGKWGGSGEHIKVLLADYNNNCSYSEIEDKTYDNHKKKWVKADSYPYLVWTPDQTGDYTLWCIPDSAGFGSCVSYPACDGTIVHVNPANPETVEGNCSPKFWLTVQVKNPVIPVTLTAKQDCDLIHPFTDLSWNPITPPAGETYTYQAYVNDVASGSPVTGNSITGLPATSGVATDYMVDTISSSGMRVDSNDVWSTGVYIPQAPSTVTAVSNATVNNVSWTEPAQRGETGFNIYRYHSLAYIPDGDKGVIDSVGKSVFTYTDTTPVCANKSAFQVPSNFGQGPPQGDDIPFGYDIRFPPSSPEIDFRCF